MDPRLEKRTPAWRGEEGYVLLWALFAFILLSGFAAVALKSSGSQRRMSKSTANWNESFYAAEAGLAQVLQIATDTLVGSLSPGDSVDLGWQPIAGTAEYRGVVYRIDGGGQRLYLARSTGRVPGLYSGQTTTSVVYTTQGDAGAGMLSGIPLTISGRAKVYGGCQVHANDLLNVPGELRTDAPVSSSGPALGNIKTATGKPKPVVPEQFADPETVEPPIPPSMCSNPDYRVENGWKVDVAAGDSVFVGGAPAEGWSMAGIKEYEADRPKMSDGTYCVDGSLTVRGSPGTPGNNQTISIAARGFVEIVGNPYIEAAHSSDILIAAEGDIYLDGNEHPVHPNYSGEIRAGSNCDTSSGGPWISGSLSCNGDPDPPGIRSIVTDNEITGNLKLTTSCPTAGGGGGVVDPIRLDLRAWQHEY